MVFAMAIDIDLRTIGCFVVLAEELNFTRASRRLHLSQPSLSAQIRKLEEDVRASLFERTTRMVTLTATGAALLPQCRALLDQADLIRSQIELLRGRDLRPVVLGAPFYTFHLSEHATLLASLHRELPDVALRVDNGFTSLQLARLSRGEVDMALVIALPVSRAEYLADHDANAAGELEVPDDLPRLTIRRAPIELAVPREHVLAEWPGKIPLSALAGIDIAVPSVDHGRAVVSPIMHAFAAARARPFVPPEAHAIALEWYCRYHRVPAISLGWFRSHDEDDIIYRHVEGLDRSTELALVRGPRPFASSAAQQVWDHAALLFTDDKTPLAG